MHCTVFGFGIRAALHLDSMGRSTAVAARLFLGRSLLAGELIIASAAGFEAPAQFAEETKAADRTVPKGIMWSIVVTAVLGFGYLVVLLFCIQVLPTGLEFLLL